MQMEDLDTDDVDGSETDFLANCSQGYGFGYTREQALAAMARNITTPSRHETVTVDLVEHVGECEIGPYGWGVETLAGAERVEIDGADLAELAEKATEAQHAAMAALDGSERVESTE